MLKKSILLFACVAAALTLMVACSKSSNTPRGLVVGMETSYPPYTYLDTDGQPTGFDVDVAAALAQQLDRPLVIKQMSFDALIMALKQGKVDLIVGGLSITPERLKKIAMIPYHGTGLEQMELVFKAEPAASLAAVKGPIAVLRGSVQHHWLAKQPDVAPKPLDTVSDAIMEVHYGKAAAALVETHSAEAAQDHFTTLTTLTIPVQPEDAVAGMGIGIRLSNRPLALSVQEAIAQLQEQGTLGELEATWFGGSDD